MIFSYSIKSIVIFVLYFFSTCMAQDITLFLREEGVEQGEIKEVTVSVMMSIGDFKKMLEEREHLSLEKIKFERHIHKYPHEYYTFADLYIRNYDTILYTKKIKLSKEEQQKKDFMEAGFRGNSHLVKRMLKSLEPSKRLGFIASCRNPLDHDKTILYYAGRLGFIDVFKAVKSVLTKNELESALLHQDDEGRTILMAAAQAVENATSVINFVKDHTSSASWTIEDQNKRTAEDWARLRHQEERIVDKVKCVKKKSGLASFFQLFTLCSK